MLKKNQNHPNLVKFVHTNKEFDSGSYRNMTGIKPVGNLLSFQGIRDEFSLCGAD